MPPSSYETSDVYLASFLLCQGAVLADCERVSPRRFAFRFRADAQLHDLLRRYRLNTPVALVPLALFAALRELKSITRGKPLHVRFQRPVSPEQPPAGSQPNRPPVAPETPPSNGKDCNRHGNLGAPSPDGESSPLAPC